MPPSPWHVDQLPTEMWFAVCDWITSPRDISALARTCSYFADVTGPSLYSHIAWTDKNYTASVSALTKRPELYRNVRALSLKDFLFSPSWDWPPLTEMDPQLMNDLLRQPHYDLFNKIPTPLRNVVQLIPKFPHLQVLTFRRVQLPPTLYQDLKLLPALTTLNLRSCNLMSAAPADNSDLRLRHLRLDNLRWIHSSDDSRNAMCSLACTATLESLEVDAHIAPMVFHLMSSTATELNRPLTLRSLKTEARSDEAGDFVSIASFLANASSIEMLHLRRVPKTVSLPAAALPNLRVLSGPAHCIEALVNNRPVEHVRILDQLPATRQHHNALISLLGTQHTANVNTGNIFAAINAPQQAQPPPPQPPADPQATATSWAEVVQVMEKVARTGPPLRRLDFRMTTWDTEVLYMLAALFPNLRDIRINCTLEGPHEDFMVEFASQFMTAFPQLEALHVFGDNTRARGQTELLSETRGHIGLWEKHNPHLREVAMSSDIVWRKYGERDWGKTEPTSWPGFGYH